MKDASTDSLLRPRARAVRAFGLLSSFVLLGALYGTIGAGCSDSDATSADGGPVGTSTSTSTSPTGSSTGTTAPGSDGSAPQDASTSTDASIDAAPVDPFAGVPAATLVKDGFVFLEGPLWLAAQNKLIFSDVQGNRIYQLVPPATTASDFRNPSGGANGNAVDKNGVLYTCEHTNHRVSRTLANGTVEPVVETFGGKKLNSPNDVIVRSDLNVYFTDPDYAADASNRQAKQNVFRVAPGGAVTVIDDTLDKPNGIALSPDQNTLYVAEIGRAHV
jgi:gluconolactonase